MIKNLLKRMKREKVVNTLTIKGYKYEVENITDANTLIAYALCEIADQIRITREEFLNE